MSAEMTRTSITPRWEIRIGSPVECPDGRAGTVERVVVSPRTRQVTHLIVHRGLLLHHDVVVPVEAIEDADDERVRLRLSLAELAARPPYSPADYLPVSADWVPPAGYTRDQVLLALPRPIAALRALVAAPAGQVESPDTGTTTEPPTITSGTRVIARDGEVGTVDRVLLDPVTRRATHFVVRKGTLFGHDLIVPVEWATTMSPDGVVLDVGREQLARLPEYRPDDELAADVEEALWDDEILRRVDLPLLRATVQDGIVTLEGNVVTSVHRQRAEEIVRKVPGVLGVRNQLIGDDDLEVAVAQALGRDERTRRHLIRVKAVQGVVYLSGDVVPAAEEIAARIPGVRGVEVGSPTGV